MKFSSLQSQYFYFIFFFCISCSSDDSGGQEPEPFLNVSVSKSEVEVDEVFTVFIEADQNIVGIGAKSDFYEEPTSDPTFTIPNQFVSDEFELFTELGNVGTHNLEIMVRKEDNTTESEEVQIKVVAGDAIKVNKITVTSFETDLTNRDDEFPDGDTNRNADVFISMFKETVHPLSQANSFVSSIPFFTSNVIENAGNINQLVWNLTDEEIYIQSDKTFHIAMFDEDGSQDEHMLNASADYSITFGNLTSSIVVKEFSTDNLTIEFELED